MYAVAGAINVAAPDALETHQNVAMNLRAQLLHLVGEGDCRSCTQMMNRTGWPLVRRPVIARDELRFVAKIDNSASEAFQISFRAATGGISAADKTDAELLRRHLADCHPAPSRRISQPPSA